MPSQTDPVALSLDRLPTPLGEALLVTDAQGWLRGLDWADHEARLRRLLALQNGAWPIGSGRAPQAIRCALDGYFAGDLTRLGTIAWRTGGTPFQRSVWAELARIPPGATLSYGALAARLGCPKAVRAVGLANGANPVSLVVPCHRVIGADGSLTGYGGGLARKRWLLAHEAAAGQQLALWAAQAPAAAPRP